MTPLFPVSEDMSLDNGGVFADTTAAMALLEAVRQEPREGKRSWTQWSCVYNQSMASVEIAMDMHYGRIYRFALSEQ